MLRLYLLGAREAWGIEPRGATLVHVLDGATRGVHPDAADDAEAVEAVRDAAEGISAAPVRAAPLLGLPHLRLRAPLPGAGPVTPLSALEPGAPLEGVYAVRRKERRLSRQGRPFLALTLADATGAVPAVVFDEPDFFAAQFEEGDRVRVTGRVGERDGRPRVVLSHLRAAPDEAAAEDLLPRAHRDPDELFGFVLHLADEVGDPGLRAVLDALTGDAALARDWRTMPCTRSGHHAYLGGLVEHTVGVAALVQALTTWHPRLDADLLLAAALVARHRARARVPARARPSSRPTRAACWGTWRSGTRSSATPPAPPACPAARRAELLHVIGWHHGPPPGQAAGAASPEALALWRANALETGVKARLEGPGPGVADP